MTAKRHSRLGVRYSFGAGAIVAALWVATIVAPWQAVGAQDSTAKPTVSPSTSPAEPPAGPKTNVYFQFGSRGYSIGGSKVTEQAGNLTYEYRTKQWGLSVDGSSLNYGALGRTISGTGNSNVRFDYMLQPGDSLMVYGRSGSKPGTLDSVQVEAIGVAGGSLVDLQANSLGNPSMFGGRAVFSYPVGDLVLNLRGALEVESKPVATQEVYWRGTTWAIGSTLYGNVGKAQLAAMVDISSSSSDSLGGKNLYPGGGETTFSLDLHLPIENPADSTGDDWDSAFSAWFSSPFGATRADQPNLLLPLGNSFGLSGALSFPVGGATWGPSVQFQSTSASATAKSGATSLSTSASGWAANFAINADIPTGSIFELTPEVGYAIGNASTSYGETSTKTVIVQRRGRTVTTTSGGTTATALRGWWIALGVSAHF